MSTMTRENEQRREMGVGTMLAQLRRQMPDQGIGSRREGAAHENG